MTTWTFIWLMVLLKIPVVGLFLIVRWAVRDAPAASSEQQDGGIGPRPPHPHRPRSRPPRLPRRGPHHSPAPAPPMRVRGATAHQRLPRG